jgi:predicted DNA-binding protein YlxM (UPF0122 family)
VLAANYLLINIKTIDMNDNKLNRSELIYKRLIECDGNGELLYPEQLKILNFYIKKFNLATKSHVAKQRGVSCSAISQSIKRGNEMIFKLNETELICN